jgi:hypothetical protein
MRRCFLHIGTHKTGTTSIQHALNNVRSSLTKRNLFYPQTGIPSEHFGHHNIAWELVGDRRFRPDGGTVEDLLGEIDQTDHDVIISSEDFACAAHRTERFENFVVRLKQHALDVVIVVYFRDQIGYARSLYLQLVDLGYDTSFDDFAAGVIESRHIKWKDWVFAFSYDEFLRQLPSGTTVVARPYERAGCVVTDFLSTLGLTPADLGVQVAERLNPQISVGKAFSAFYLTRTGRRLAVEAPWIASAVSLALNGAEADISNRTKKRLIAACHEPNSSIDSRFGFFAGADLQEKIAVFPAESPDHLTFEGIFSPTMVRLVEASAASAHFASGERERTFQAERLACRREVNEAYTELGAERARRTAVQERERQLTAGLATRTAEWQERERELTASLAARSAEWQECERELTASLAARSAEWQECERELTASLAARSAEWQECERELTASLAARSAEWQERELELTASLAVRTADLQQRDKELIVARERAAAAETALLRRNEELAALRNSLSWRVTAPLRWLGAVLRSSSARDARDASEN